MSDNYITAADLDDVQKHVLRIVANLLPALGIHIEDGKRFYQDTLDALDVLPPDIRTDFEEMASWVFDYDTQSEADLNANKTTFNWRKRKPWERDKTWKQVVSEIARGTSA